MDAKIDVESDVVLNLVKSYKDVNNNLETMASGCKKPDIPKCLDIGSNIDGLMGVVQNAETELSTKMLDVVGVLNDTIDELRRNDEINLVDYLFSENDMSSINKSDILADFNLSYDEYITLVDNVNELFDGVYANLADNIKCNIGFSGKSFLNKTVPSTVNIMVENTYLKYSKRRVGSNEYQEGLEEFKSSFANSIFRSYEIDINNFDINKSEIPKDLWESSDDYGKSLLVLSYKSVNFNQEFNNKFNLAIKESGVEYGSSYEYSQTLSELKSLYEFYNIDFDTKLEGKSGKEQVNELIKTMRTYSDNLEKSYKSLDNTDYLQFYGYDENSWEKVLRDNGYIDDEIITKYGKDVVLQQAFNSDFLAGIAKKDGIEKVYTMLESYYGDESSIILDDLFKVGQWGRSLGSKLALKSTYQTLYDDISGIYDKSSKDKITLDACVSNYKMMLSSLIDTSKVTDNDVENAKNLIGANAKYLEDSELRTYASLYKENPSYADKLLNDTYYNIIQSGIGHDQAVIKYKDMTGEDKRKLLYDITGNSIISDMLGTASGLINAPVIGMVDGVIKSVRNVADVALADGKMDSFDYNLYYLQELLSQGGTQNDILKLGYNLGSGVGNMAIPMALSAFISPMAMSAWIAASTFGSETEQGLRDGEEKNAQLYANAISKALVAVGSEKLLGALKGYGAKEGELLGIFNSDAKLMTKFMSSPVGKMLAYNLSNSVHETGEELFENVAGYVIDKATGKEVNISNIPAETWETIYMTMLETPLINIMGAGFQNSKYSAGNRQTEHDFNGVTATYSNNELSNFYDENGNFDRAGFIKYLTNNNRLIYGKEIVDKMPDAKPSDDELASIVSRNGEGILNFIYDICAADANRVELEENLTDEQKIILSQLKRIAQQIGEYRPYGDSVSDEEIRLNSEGLLNTLLAVNEGIRNAVDNSMPVMRISANSALRVLLDGMIKNIYQVNESDGAIDKNGRIYIDNKIFGMPSGTVDADSAIYALLAPKLDDTNGGEVVSYLRNGPGNWYGRGNRESKLGTTQVYFRLNPDKIGKYSTITLGDSFDHALPTDMALARKFSADYEKTIVSGSPFLNPFFTGAYYDSVAKTGDASGLFYDTSGMGVRRISEIRNADIFLASPMVRPGMTSSDGYFEVQIWGEKNHSTDIIDAIYIDDNSTIDPVTSKPYKGVNEELSMLIDLATEKGIPIYFLDDLNK